MGLLVLQVPYDFSSARARGLLRCNLVFGVSTFYSYHNMLSSMTIHPGSGTDNVIIITELADDVVDRIGGLGDASRIDGIAFVAIGPAEDRSSDRDKYGVPKMTGI